MPIRAENRARYPKNWKAISLSIRERAGNACESYGAKNGHPHFVTGARVVLTVAHLDHQPENCDDANLRAMCQRCHLTYDGEHHARNAARSRAARATAGMEPLL